MCLRLQKLEMQDFMEEDVKFTLWTRETDIHDLKSKGVKGKYIDAEHGLYPTVIYYDRYPLGHPTKTVCVDNLREKRNNSVIQSSRHVLLFSVAQGPQHGTKII